LVDRRRDPDGGFAAPAVFDPAGRLLAEDRLREAFLAFAGPVWSVGSGAAGVMPASADSATC